MNVGVPHAPQPRRADHGLRGVVIAIVVGLVLMGCLAAALLWPSSADPDWIRVTTVAKGSVCDTMDLEVDLKASTAKVRSWFPLNDGTGRCGAKPQPVSLTPDHAKRLRRASRELARASVLGVLMDERRAGRVEVEWKEIGGFSESTSSRKYEGVRPEGLATFETIYQALVAAPPAAPAPPAAAPPTAAPPARR
jgi:hypothetical protein